MSLEDFIDLKVVIVLLFVNLFLLNQELSSFPVVLLFDVIEGFAGLLDSLQLLLHIFNGDASLRFLVSLLHVVQGIKGELFTFSLISHFLDLFFYLYNSGPPIGHRHVLEYKSIKNPAVVLHLFFLLQHQILELIQLAFLLIHSQFQIIYSLHDILLCLYLGDIGIDVLEFEDIADLLCDFSLGFYEG